MGCLEPERSGDQKCICDLLLGRVERSAVRSVIFSMLSNMWVEDRVEKDCMNCDLERRDKQLARRRIDRLVVAFLPCPLRYCHAVGRRHATWSIAGHAGQVVRIQQC